MKSLTLSLAALLFAASAHAQPIVPPIPIHGHPQLTEYSDRKQLPKLLASHMNWAPGENPVASQVGGDGVLDIVAGRLGNSVLGHEHLGFKDCPTYGELTGPYTCRFQVLAFNIQARIFMNPANQDGIRDLVWDATGTSTAPDMVGELGKEKIWEGSITIDPSLPNQFPTVHGWWNPSLTAEVRFDNGDIVNKLIYNSFFVVLDPAAPERFGVPFISARVEPHEQRHSEGWGSQIVETLRGQLQYLPLRPLQPGEVFHTIFATNGYGADGLPLAIAEQRNDSDIHKHLGGTVVQQVTKKGIINLDAAFDSSILSAGNHKVIIGRRQEGLFGDAAVVVQLVFDVGVAAPPVLTCQDHAATNFGGPLPCLFPPPPPVLEWQSFGLGAWNVSFEREVNATTGTTTGRFRACIGTQCIVLP